MSRVAKNPIHVPKTVDISIDGSQVQIKGPKGAGVCNLGPGVEVVFENQVLTISEESIKVSKMLSGTARAQLANLVRGVSEGFDRTLNLVGVGYRASVKGNSLALTLGHSHPIEYVAPDGIVIETPTQTEILVKGWNKQLVGQVSSNIRAFRPPEPYKGKGVRYSDEVIVRKEAKKK